MCDSCKYGFVQVKELAESVERRTLESIGENLASRLGLETGGKWWRAANQTFEGRIINRVAIIVPYRDRLKNLKIFAYYMHEFLVQQARVNYVLFVVEPTTDNNLTFNRALLLNIGFREASLAAGTGTKFDCFIFHDVDMLPENVERNEYVCDLDYPKQFATSISIYAYSEMDYFKKRYMGGVTGFTLQQFEKINGYSNSFYGWGGEGSTYSFFFQLAKKSSL